MSDGLSDGIFTIGGREYEARKITLSRDANGLPRGVLIQFDLEDNAPAPTPDLIPGEHVIDVSEYQTIDWPVVKSVARIDKAMIRISYGSTVDAKKIVNWQGAKQSAVGRGGYHYYQNETDPVVQSDTFLRGLGNDIGEIKWALDIEDKVPSITLAEFDEIHGWLERVEADTGVRGRIYTGQSVYDWEHAPAWVKDYELWKGQYTLGACAPLLPWGQPRLWQFTGHGRIPGIAGNVDLNIVGDGATPPAREWWWRGCFSDVADANGIYPANYFVRAINSPISFCDAPHGKVVETRPVSYPMTVTRITADGWLQVARVAGVDWWCEKSQVRLGQ